MASYITVQEGFIDAVKERVKHNIGNAADHVNVAMNHVHKFGQGMKDASYAVAKGAYKVSKYMNDEDVKEEPEKKKVKREEEDDDDDYYDESSVPQYKMATTSLIKRQIPNGATHTIRPIKQVTNTLKVFNKKGLM